MYTPTIGIEIDKSLLYLGPIDKKTPAELQERDPEDFGDMQLIVLSSYKAGMDSKGYCGYFSH
ncbi:hypothetical protein [Endozoicomonas sp. YOMI1]|uniref:hypothetical protein n=1 Tax=Endozoicomonas sp. YOMI1 TaxID=2828739 RepID=UPI002149047C|nr:hypothetical protein [Endozoicomonas sp. YOMI1]